MSRLGAAAVLSMLAVTALAASGGAAQNKGLTGVVAIGGGGGHVLAVKADGTVWAWGHNAHGQIGIGRPGAPVLSPTRVPGLTGVTQVIGAEFHTVVLKKNGTVWAWGDNEFGQLGLGTTGADESSPVHVPGLTNVTAVDADQDQSFALLKDGTVRAWGKNGNGQLGNGTTTQVSRPVRVKISNVAALASGAKQTLALTNGKSSVGKGAVFSWGGNQNGQLGIGTSCSSNTSTSCNQTTPVRVKGLPGKAIAIAGGTGGDYSMALMANGTVWAWGRNDQGQLGRGNLSSKGCKCETSPGQVRGPTGVTAIAASGGAGVALTTKGTVWAWGNNEFGQLGRGKKGGTSGTPQLVQGLTGVKALTAGGGYIVALKSDRTVVAWGMNTFGQLGIGTTEHSPTPVRVGLVQTAAATSKSFFTTTTLLLIFGGGLGLIVLVWVARSVRRRPVGVWGAPRPQEPMPFTPVAFGSHASGATSMAPAMGGSARETVIGQGGLAGAWEEYGRRVRFLSRVDLFRGVSHDALAEVATSLKQVAVPTDGIVCREGDVGGDFFMVETGTLAVTAEIGGRPRELARLGPGEFLGEVALLGRGRRTATVKAISDAQLWSLSSTDFAQVLAQQPEVEAAVRRAAAERGASNGAGAFEVEQRELAGLKDGARTIRMGRSEDNDVVFTSRLVSSHHAVVEGDGDGFRLRDLGSLNGTYVNGVKVRSVELKDGDEIWLGDERFVFDRRAIRRSVEPQGIRIDATGLTREVRGGKTLLQDISLSILPGEFVAIVGGSGAGKTTLMDAMSAVQPATRGTVLYNGRDYYQNLAFFRNVLGYVPQDDIIHTGLPLRVTLRHAAKLRLPPDTSPEELDRAVDEALAELELTQQANLKVGLLSGGQRKRSSIGVELLTQPRVFFLDEPTSGLDPFTESQMMALLRRLADNGSTVVLTTHATANVMLCDKVVFLARGGHLAFVGTPHRALRYFDAESFDVIYRRLAEEATPEEWAQRFRESADYRQLVGDQVRPRDSGTQAGRHASLAQSGPSGGLGRTLRQFVVLSRRGFDLFRYNPSTLPSLVMPPLIFTLLALALFKSGVFENQSNSAAALQIVFLIAFSAFIFGLLFAVQEIVKEFPIFRRERMVNLHIVPYVLSKTTFLAPLLTVLLIVMVGILRLAGRLPAAGGLQLYSKLFLTLVLTGFVGLALALFTSALVSNSQQATDMLSVWIMPQVLFGGALLAVPLMNVFGKVISAVAPVRWSFEAIGQIVNLNNQFDVDTSRIGPGLAIQYTGSFTRSPVQNWLILALFIVIPLALTCVVLKRKTTAR